MISDLNSDASPARPRSLADLTPVFELDRIVTRVIGEMGLGEATATAADGESGDASADFSVLHFVILPQRSVWLDFALETDRASAARIYELFSGEHSTHDHDLEDVLRETMNMIHGSLKAAFRDTGVDVIIPLVPQSIASEKLHGHNGGCTLQSRHVFHAPGITLRLTMIARVAPITHKELKHFRLAEVVVDPVAAEEAGQLTVVKRHTMLNKRLLEKVQQVAALEKAPTTHAVIPPSLLAQLLTND